MHTGNVRMSLQTLSRGVFESMIREISDAVYVYDNLDDPTLSSLIFVLPNGVGTNANQSAPGSVIVPILLPPGPGADYNVTTHCMFTTR